MPGLLSITHWSHVISDYHKGAEVMKKIFRASGRALELAEKIPAWGAGAEYVSLVVCVHACALMCVSD